jgi:hypothetical protein
MYFNIVRHIYNSLTSKCTGESVSGSRESVGEPMRPKGCGLLTHGFNVLPEKEGRREKGERRERKVKMFTAQQV